MGAGSGPVKCKSRTFLVTPLTTNNYQLVKTLSEFAKTFTIVSKQASSIVKQASKNRPGPSSFTGDVDLQLLPPEFIC